ncbi:hypothetical protein V8F33_004691 [Rhypophila sp. PSN 637]
MTKGVVFFPASWDTNDEDADYKNHIWNQATKALSEPVQMVTEPPSAVAVPWGYRWLADELALFRFNEDYDDPELFPLSSAYLAGPTTPNAREVQDRVVDPPLWKVTVIEYWYDRASIGNTKYGPTGTRVNEHVTSANDAQATTGSTAILPKSSPLISTLGVTTIVSVEVQPSPSTSADMTSIGEPSVATGQDENPWTLQIPSISKGTGGEVLTQRPPVPTSSAGANTSVNTRLTQTIRHNSPSEQDIAADGPTGTQETIITKEGKPGSASISDPNTFIHLDSDEAPVKMQTTVVSVFTSATGPIPPKVTLSTEAQRSGAFSTSDYPNAFLLPDSNATPVKPQTTDISALTWATRDDHTAINNFNKSGITRLPSPAATSSSRHVVQHDSCY